MKLSEQVQIVEGYLSTLIDDEIVIKGLKATPSIIGTEKYKDYIISFLDFGKYKIHISTTYSDVPIMNSINHDTMSSYINYRTDNNIYFFENFSNHYPNKLNINSTIDDLEEMMFEIQVQFGFNNHEMEVTNINLILLYIFTKKYLTFLPDGYKLGIRVSGSIPYFSEYLLLILKSLNKNV